MSAGDNITASFNGPAIVGGLGAPSCPVVFGPVSGTASATAANGAALSVTTGANVSLTLTAANGTQVCSVTGGTFPYAAVGYTSIGLGPFLLGCNTTACTNATLIWIGLSAQNNGCPPSMACGPPGSVCTYCASTCTTVSPFMYSSSPSPVTGIYLSAGATWYETNNQTSWVSVLGVSGVVQAASSPPLPPPAPPPPTPPPPPSPPITSVDFGSLSSNNTNVSALSAAVSSSLSSLSSNASALAEAQASILTSLTSSNSSAPLSSASAPAANLSTVGGVTRLAFSTATGPMEVSNASTPITFTLPAVSNSGTSTQAVCSFYDTVAQAYSTAGCIGVPNPGPANHTLAFVPGYQTPSDASLANAWNISGPMLAGCQTTVIDCSLADPPVIYPDPRQPLVIPAVSCPVNATKPPVLRVFYGTNCQLWQPSNPYNCSWNNTLQAFNGTGCVATGNVTQCMCRHLTDFAAARTPKLTTCSLSDMLSLNPADIVTKLRMLFIVVITLFGVMNLGAVVGFILDVRARKQLVQQLQRPEAEFVEMPGGVWTWTFRQLPLKSSVEAPRGSAPTLAFIFGIPLVRLRTALPDELCGDWTLGQSLGRADGLSLNFMADAKEDHDRAVLAARTTKLPDHLDPHSHAAPGRIPSTRFASLDSELAMVAPPGWRGKGAAAAAAAFGGSAAQVVVGTPVPGAPVIPGRPGSKKYNRALAAFKEERMTGTALVLAFLSVNNQLPTAELTHRKEAAAEFFRDTRVPGVHHDFEALLRLFMGMLFDGNLGQRQKWLQKARMWRTVLLQHDDGSWGLSQGLAAAVEAHSPCDGITAATKLPGKPGPLARILALVSASAGEGDLDTSPETLDSASVAQLYAGDEDAQRAHDTNPRSDDPMHFSQAAMAAAMPHSLAALAPAGLPVSRIWATLLASVTLEELEICWLASDEEEPVESTVVDHADAYLRSQAELHPALDELLRTGQLHWAARQARARWVRLMEAKITAVRKADVTVGNRVIEYTERASARVVLSLMTEHEQFSTFLDETAGLMRWQRWMILMTLVIAALLVSIWFYQSRGAQCCAEIRAILDCESAVSCLGFTGSCADLPAQFSTLQGPFVYGVPPQEYPDLSQYVCHAFPDDTYPLDQLLVALINIAIGLPIGMFLFRCFEIANEGEDWPDAWLEVPKGLITLAFRLFYGRHLTGRWHYRPPLEGEGCAVDTDPKALKPVAQCRSDLVQWYVRHSGEMPTMWAQRTLAWVWRKLSGSGSAEPTPYDGLPPAFREGGAADVGESIGKGEPAGEGSEPEAEEEEDAGAADALAKRLYAASGLVGIYLAWAIFSWFIFTYGMLIYRQLGDDAQKQFAKSWGVNFGLDSAQQWRDVAVETGKITVILIILDLLVITGPRNWFEEHLDHLSIQCTLFTGAATGWWRRTWHMVSQQKRLSNG